MYAARQTTTPFLLDSLTCNMSRAELAACCAAGQRVSFISSFLEWICGSEALQFSNKAGGSSISPSNTGTLLARRAWKPSKLSSKFPPKTTNYGFATSFRRGFSWLARCAMGHTRPLTGEVLVLWRLHCWWFHLVGVMGEALSACCFNTRVVLQLGQTVSKAGH